MSRALLNTIQICKLMVSNIGVTDVSYFPMPNEASPFLIAFSIYAALCATSKKDFAKISNSCNLKSLSIRCASKAKIAFLVTQSKQKISYNETAKVTRPNQITYLLAPNVC